MVLPHQMRSRSSSLSIVASSPTGSSSSTSDASHTNWVVSRILAHRIGKAGDSSVDYHILWLSGEESWEPESLMDCDDLIQDYENELAAALAANLKGKHKRIEEEGDETIVKRPRLSRVSSRTGIATVSSPHHEPVASSSRLPLLKPRKSPTISISIPHPKPRSTPSTSNSQRKHGISQSTASRLPDSLQKALPKNPQAELGVGAFAGLVMTSGPFSRKPSDSLSRSTSVTPLSGGSGRSVVVGASGMNLEVPCRVVVARWVGTSEGGEGADSSALGAASGSGSGSMMEGSSTEIRVKKVVQPYRQMRKDLRSISPPPPVDLSLPTDSESTIQQQLLEFQTTEAARFPRRERKKSVARLEADDEMIRDLDLAEEERKLAAKALAKIKRKEKESLRKEVERLAPQLLRRAPAGIKKKRKVVSSKKVVSGRDKGKAVDRSEHVGNNVRPVQEEESEEVESISIEQLVEELQSTTYYGDRIVPLLVSHPSLPLALGRALGFSQRELSRLQGKICMVLPPSTETDSVIEEWNALILLLQYCDCISTRDMNEIEVAFIQRGTPSDHSSAQGSLRYLAARGVRRVEFFEFGGEEEVRGIYESGLYVIPTMVGLISLLDLSEEELRFFLDHPSVRIRIHPSTLTKPSPDLPPEQHMPYCNIVQSIAKLTSDEIPPPRAIESIRSYPPIPYPSLDVDSGVVSAEQRRILEALALRRSGTKERRYVMLGGSDEADSTRLHFANQGIDLLSLEELMRIVKTSVF